MTERSATGEWPAPAKPAPAEVPVVPGYEILSELGRGGMGVVYKARQLSLKRLIALKLIRDGALAGPQERARFRIEAEAAARMQHPHIVQVYEAGEHQGRPYFAMELVEGASLDEHLAGQPQPAPQAAELVRTLALAVQHAHTQQVVHRDLKPANVLLANPKPQTASLKEAPASKDQIPKREAAAAPLRLGDSDLGFPCDLSFEICDFTPKIADFGLAKRLDIE